MGVGFGASVGVGILCREPLPQAGDAGRIPAPAARRFDLAPIQLSSDGGMGHRTPRRPHRQSSPAGLGALGSRRADRRQGGQIASRSAAERRCAIRIAEGAALLSEPFAGHGKGVPGALGDHLALALGDHRHDADHGLVGVRQIGRR